MKVALADKDVCSATALIKPAVLYADQVTIHSPTASLLNAARGLGKITDRAQQIETILEIIHKVPTLANQLDADPRDLEQLKTLLGLDRRAMAGLRRLPGVPEEIGGLLDKLGEFDALWDDQIPNVMNEIQRKFGAGELFAAMDDGCVAVADMGTTNEDYVAASLRAATGDSQDGDLDDVVAVFAARLLEILTEPHSFPLMDAASADLARALEREVGSFSDQGMRRGTEVSSAVSFMGFLPSFEDLEMDEILDLRTALRGPLVRFRGALAVMSREFQMRPIEEGFEAELEDAWRRQVRPALQDLRESMAEHGLLKETASVALGDPRRLFIEAGGVVAAAHGAVIDLPGLMTAGVAAGLPIADTLGRALLRSFEARREVRKNAFFFLHQLEHEARQRARAS